LDDFVAEAPPPNAGPRLENGAPVGALPRCSAAFAVWIKPSDEHSAFVGGLSSPTSTATFSFTDATLLRSLRTSQLKYRTLRPIVPLPSVLLTTLLRL